ncbi:MAG: GTP-binding protein [Proteobacteria bacterium]|nr:GTP-binding protein [Pseudomonadota bacterium]
MKTRVFIVTGFLGAGKTTLLKKILGSCLDLSKTIVLVNEFGKVGIDGELIKSTAAADIVELTSGCICCSLKTDMIQALQILKHTYAPERIVIEATGVADPLSIIDALNDRMLSPYFQLEKTITVVDCDFWEARDAFGTVFKSQLDQADILLINKIDTLSPSQISVILNQIQAQAVKAMIIPTLHCNIDPDIFWAESKSTAPMGGAGSFLKPYDPDTDLYSTGSAGKTATAKEAGFVSFSFETSQVFDEHLFVEFLGNLPLELFRIKGPVRFAHSTKMLNYVGGKCQWQDWPDTAATRLAFIGWTVIEGLVLEKLNLCLVRTKTF